MQQVDVERSQEFRKCIECFLCQDTCHVVRDHEENKEAFAGPRFLMRIAELDMHPLDAGRPPGRGAARSTASGMCNITKCCTEVCPEHIKITDNALIPMKERVVDRKYDPWCGWATRSGAVGTDARALTRATSSRGPCSTWRPPCSGRTSHARAGSRSGSPRSRRTTGRATRARTPSGGRRRAPR